MSEIGKLAVAYRQVAQLKINSHNARTHSRHQIRQIAASIKEFGFTNPVLIDNQNVIIAGHGRVTAAKTLGISEVPTISLENLSDDQIRAYIVADNRLAENAGWDNSILAIELQHLLKIEGDFDVTITGFEIPEIDLILSDAGDEADPADNLAISKNACPVSSVGDLWRLNRHYVLCGNALREDAYTTLFGSKRAAAVFVDPPYNVPIDGNVCGKGAVRHREFEMASGEMSEFEFTSFLTCVLKNLARSSSNGSIHFVCMDFRHMGELLNASKQVYEALLNLCVWVKNNGGMGSFYRSRHELIFVFRNGSCQHRNNVQLGRFGRNRTNVWEYPSVNTLAKVGDEGNLLALHPTVKPVAMVADALLDCSARGEIVLDAFLGSGSTLIAAERTGRNCYGMEIDPLYIDTAIRRWQRHTGDHAIHVSTGKRFDEMDQLVREKHDGEE